MSIVDESHTERCQFVVCINSHSSCRGRGFSTSTHASVYLRKDFPINRDKFYAIFFSLICACPHRTNVFIFSSALIRSARVFISASDKRERSRRHLFKIIVAERDYL
jgi:hypothetical protein